MRKEDDTLSALPDSFRKSIMAEFKRQLSIPNADKVSQFLSNLSPPPLLLRLENLCWSSLAERNAQWLSLAGCIIVFLSATPEATRGMILTTVTFPPAFVNFRPVWLKTFLRRLSCESFNGKISSLDLLKEILASGTKLCSRDVSYRKSIKACSHFR